MHILKLNQIAKQMSDNLIEILKSSKNDRIKDLKSHSEELIRALMAFKGYEGNYKYDLGRVVGRLEAIAKILYKLSHE